MHKNLYQAKKTMRRNKNKNITTNVPNRAGT